MNKKIGMIGSVVSCMSVIFFAVTMIMQFNFGSFFVCMILAFGFILMIAAFANECSDENKASAIVALVFSGIYATLVLLVYFAQTTSVRLDDLNQQSLYLIDYSK